MNALKRVRTQFVRVPSFTLRDVRLLLSKEGKHPGYAKLLLQGLEKKGEIYRLSKGTYTLHEDVQLAGLGFQPYYYGLQNALSLHGVGTQETNPVVVTPRKARPGVRSFYGVNFVVRRIDRSMFFGFESQKYHGFWINVSDLEKTVIDFAYYREPLDEQTRQELLERIRLPVLNQYLAKCPAYVTGRVRKFLASGSRSKV